MSKSHAQWLDTYILGVALLGAFAAVLLHVDAGGALDARAVWFLLLAVGLEIGSFRNGRKASVALSVSFISGLAAALLFGGLAFAVVAAGASVVPSVRRGIVLRKLVFNVSQHLVAVGAAWFLYRVTGGQTPAPPLSLDVASGLGPAFASFGRLIVLATSYLFVNSVLVAAVVAISSGASLVDHWRRSQPLQLGLDIGGAAVGFLLALAFVFCEERAGSGLIGLALVAVPVLISRKSAILVRELQQSGEELLGVMVKAIEARDPYTSGHSIRVQSLAVAIGADLGLSGRDYEALRTAALLHDIGKIHEEFAPILRKDGKLTEEERILMESHAERGAVLVSSITKFRGPIEDAVRHHHERWDGRGYPHGLQGEQIPLIARIIHVADTIDAMTTDRPYRARLGFDVVVSELKRHSGSQFDPEVAECAMTSLAVRRILTEPAPAAVDGSARAAKGMAVSARQ